MIPFYILGLLQRFGPQHGYQIKKIITEQLADFTQIKLPTIYYHLDKMEKNELLAAKRQKLGSRPEKTIYSITDKGVNEFKHRMTELLEFEYKPVFLSDGLFYFSDYIESAEIADHLMVYIEKLKVTLSNLQNHKEETLRLVPAEFIKIVNIIFSHHTHHYQAELEWAEKILIDLR